MERISWFIEDLRDEQEKQRIIPAPYTIRNRVEGTMDKLEYDIARLRYGAAYHSGEFNIDRISPDVWDDMKMAESDMLLIFADIRERTSKDRMILIMMCHRSKRVLFS